jgi:hypothetical protein
MQDAQNEAADWNVRTGDICRYISENGYGPADGNLYRLPTSNEFGRPGVAAGSPFIDWTSLTLIDGWLKVNSNTWSTASSNDATGKYVGITTGGKYGPTGNFFPASGYRLSDGLMENVGKVGIYWSGSLASSYSYNYSYILEFTASYVSQTVFSDRSDGFSVRCVLQ